MPEEKSGSNITGPSSVSNGAIKKGIYRKRKRRKKPLYVAALDLGTNNCRLLIAHSHHNGFKIVDSYSNVVRLGAGLAKTGKLSEKSMDDALKAISACAQKMKNKNVRRHRCIATQACRQAENGAEFLARVKSETGLSFETISPKVEARLSVMGCLNIIDHNKDIALVIDIGGGSTELSWVDVRKLRSGQDFKLHRPPIAAWVSIPVGVVNLSEIYPETDDDRYKKMKEHVLQEIVKRDRHKQFTNLFEQGRGHLVGTSGTVTSLASVQMGLPFYQRDKVDGAWLSAEAMLDTARVLAGMNLEKRSSQPCIGEDRAAMIVAGCAILDVIYELWPSEKIRVADRGLREGLLMGLLNKTQIPKPRKTSKSIRNAINHER